MFNQTSFDTLVLSGGGFKGILQLGALEYYYSYLVRIKKYIGTSIGSIINYLLILGYTPIEILSHICMIDFVPELNTNMLYLVVKLVSLVMKGQNVSELISQILSEGLIDYKIINDILHKLTLSKLSFIPTLKELYDVYGKELVCCTFRYVSNANLETKNNEIYYLTKDTTPNLNCLEALRMSSNLPFIFGLYKKDGYNYIDGGIINNFPINLCNNSEKTFGIYLDTTKYYQSEFCFLYIPFFSQQDDKIEKYRYKKNIKLLKLNIEDISINMTREQKIKVFSNGYLQAKKSVKEKID